MLVATHTDVGIKKPVNQDSLIVKEMKIKGGESVLFAAVCDGMGGLINGEIASAAVVKALDEWFNTILPAMLLGGVTNNALRSELNKCVIAVDEKLSRYSDKEGACGTTLAGLFLYNNRYATINIGDSRVYHLTEDKIFQVTHDQTVVQRELDYGRMTKEEAEKDKRKSVLLQCIGAGGDVVPVYTFGLYDDKDAFLLCSDGFRHKLSEREIAEMFNPIGMVNEEAMNAIAINAVEENKKRMEKDNISVIAIKA